MRQKRLKERIKRDRDRMDELEPTTYEEVPTTGVATERLYSGRKVSSDYGSHGSLGEDLSFSFTIVNG